MNVEWTKFPNLLVENNPKQLDMPLKSISQSVIFNCSLCHIFCLKNVTLKHCPVSWGCRIHRLLLCRGVRPPNECPGYDTEQFDGEASAMLELYGMRSTPSLPLLPGPLCPEVVAHDRDLVSMGQIELNCVIMLNWIVWNGTVFAC